LTVLTCREVTEMANDYLDRNLNWLAKLQFRLHLMMCRHCQRYVDQLAKTITLLRGSRGEPPDRGTEDKLAEIFRAGGSRPSGPSDS
jgi:predicted anti-sigma-YlaC factor YlaD